jgi:hypothetical protein
MATTDKNTQDRINKRDLSTIFSQRERVVEDKKGFTVYLKPVNPGKDPEYFRKDHIRFEPVGDDYAVEYHMEVGYQLTDNNGISFWEWERRFKPIERMVFPRDKVINFALQVEDLLWIADHWRTCSKNHDQHWREWVVYEATEANAKKKKKSKPTNKPK